ncbi:MAG TPA: hypothetical protein PLN21_04175 [Gemmatales bacterium]|nr:hypothetical protein [Gemmatales bacterium]
MTSSPLDYYRQHLTAAEQNLQLHDRRVQTLSNARLISFGLGLLFSLLAAAWSGYAAVIVAVISLIVFSVLVSRYRQAYSQAETNRALVHYYQRGIARIEDRWAIINPSPPTPLPGGERGDSNHPYAADLDLFGEGSLFELLHLGFTPMGNHWLAQWLLHPSGRETALARQAAVKELAPLTKQREDAAIRAVGLQQFKDEYLREWVNQPPPVWLPWERIATDIIVVLNAACLAAWVGGYVPGYLALASVVIMMLWSSRLQPRTAATLRGLDRQADRLQTLAGLLHYFEQQQYQAPLLLKLQSELKSGTQASTAIADLADLAQKLEWPRNAFFIPIALLLLWWTRLAFKVADWRQLAGAHVNAWLDALGQLETLHSLAALSFEHPDYTFPEIIESGRSFEAVQLGHPLIPSDKCRCNDVSFGTDPQMLLISGSNMSGKSTLLRTVGISVVIALAGGPVKAKSLRLSVLYPGATLRVQDSLQSGISRFYAEILRLRQLLDLAQEKPLLFLVDEILAGTNSAERRQGAAGILQALLDRGAIGLATTHDLALTEIAAGWSPRARNMHFADTWKDEQISFDYQLQPGVVSHGNALALMRAVGLKV